MAIKEFMARVERGIENATELRPPEPVRPAALVMRTVAPSTSVDASSELEGRLSCKETLRIDGRIKGEVSCQKMVLIGQGARVYANITADEVQILGLVEGNIAARRKITLERSAVVTGDLTTPGIVIEEGAKLRGRIVIGSDAEPALEAELAKDAKRLEALKKPPAARPKPDEAPSPQPVAATV